MNTEMRTISAGNSFASSMRELWQYRDLVMLFVRRDFVSIYKQTILGPLWIVLQPLLTTITYTIIFSRIAGISTGGVPPILFYLCGIIPWTYFAECLNKTSNTFIANSNIFGKVYFPRLAVPVSIIISNLISMGVQFLLFALIMSIYIIKGETVFSLQSSLLLIPFFVLLLAMLGLGIGLMVTALTTKYRDLRFLVTFGVQLLMFATPVIYPISSVSGKLKTIIELNPVSPIIEGMRHALLHSGQLDASKLLFSSIVVIFTLIAGIFLFNRVEKDFMDTV
jgi:lipopolysaccharide transport system permease protein